MALARRILTVAAGASVSRLLGFVRDMLIAAALGAGPIADAFFVAFRLPNLFRRLVGDGALNPAFVPLASAIARRDGDPAAQAFAAGVLFTLTGATVLICATLWLGMRPVVLSLAPGFAADADLLAFTVTLARIALPFIIFATAAATISAMLNARQKFVAAAVAPVAANGALIVALCAIAVSGRAGTAEAALWLAWGVLVSGVTQVLLCWLGARLSGAPLTLMQPRRNADLALFLRRLGPGLLAGLLGQINAFSATIIGSASASAVSVLYFADRLYQLPVGIVGVAIGVALLPDLAARFASGDRAGARRAQTTALHGALAIGLPAALALMLLARPIVAVLFERGAFDAATGDATATALRAYALGLPATVLARAAQPYFFAAGDMRLPLRVALLGAVIDVTLSLLLFPKLGATAIAVAASISAWAQATLLGFVLARHGVLGLARADVARVVSLAAASAGMGLGLWLALPLAAAWLDATRATPLRAAALALLCATGLALYAGLGHILRAFDLAALLRRG